MKAEIGHKAIVFLLTIFIFIGFPIILILSAPLILFRFIVAKSAPFVRPKLGKMVTTRGSIYAAEDYTNCPTSNALAVIVLEGQVDLEVATKSTGKRLLEAQLPNGDVRYPELKQYVTTWAGFYFWKNDKKFDIKNHVKIQPVQERFTDDDLQKLTQNLLQEPWAKKRPLWDFTFVPNYYPAGLKSSGPHTVLMKRFHHAIGDGMSFVPLLVQVVCQSELTFSEPHYPKRSFCANIVDQITFPFTASYHFADALSIGFRKNIPFGVKNGMPIGKYKIAMVDKISLKKMKEISAHFNVCFSSVVFAVLTGAIRDLLISKCMKIPNVFPFISAQPLPGHSLKLRNYVTGLILKYPVGEADPVKRLKYCDADYKYLKETAQPRLFKYVVMLAGSYFSWIIKYIGKNYWITSAVSNFPGPSSDSVHFNGHKWLDYSFVGGLQPGVNGLAFAALSFANGFRFVAGAAKGVLSVEEVNVLSASIYKHMDILHGRISTDV